MKIINIFLISSLFSILAVPVTFGAGSCPQKVTVENFQASNIEPKVIYLAEGCSGIDPRCDVR